MRVAALDLGTNTFLLLVAEVEPDPASAGNYGRIRKILRDETRMIRLGQDVHRTRSLHPEALARADACFAEYERIIKDVGGVDRVRACATSAARDVRNGNELLALGRKHDIEIEIISGETEAELTFLGAAPGGRKEKLLIIDTGGGSTEYILGDGRGIELRKSLDVGSVRLTELFVTANPIPASEFDKMAAYIREKIGAGLDAFEVPKTTPLICVAGTPTTLATLDMGLPFESEKVDGYRLPSAKIMSWTRKLAAMSVDERRRLAGMEPKRADVLVAGSLILAISAERFGAAEIEVSIRGLRYGLARVLQAHEGVTGHGMFRR